MHAAASKGWNATVEVRISGDAHSVDAMLPPQPGCFSLGGRHPPEAVHPSRLRRASSTSPSRSPRFVNSSQRGYVQGFAPRPYRAFLLRPQDAEIPPSPLGRCAVHCKGDFPKWTFHFAIAAPVCCKSPRCHSFGVFTFAIGLYLLRCPRALFSLRWKKLADRFSPPAVFSRTREFFFGSSGLLRAAGREN